MLATIALEQRRLELAGLSLELPVGWDGFVKYVDPDDQAPAVYAASVPWPDVGQNVEEAATRELFEKLPQDGIVISGVSSWYAGGEAPRKLTPPIQLGDGYFRSSYLTSPNCPGRCPVPPSLTGFPTTAYCYGVVEESDRWQIGKDFPPIDRNWPRPDDFRPAEVLTKPNPELRWLHAGGEWRGYRFSIWIASGPDAGEEDQHLAAKSATSLAVSGCGRDATQDC